MYGLHFANPSGLNNPNHYVSAYDMALIAKAAFNNPTFVEVDSTTYYDVPAGKLKQYPDGWRYYATTECCGGMIPFITTVPSAERPVTPCLREIHW